jgi:hexosaminidase
MKTFLIAVTFGLLSSCCGMAQTVSPLFARGYTVVPEPQKVILGAEDFNFSPSWQLRLDKGVAANNVAVDVLREGLATRFHVALGTSKDTSGGVLILRIAPASVQIGKALDRNKSALEEQAYRIDLHHDSITITANASTGLFYGVETLIQLLRRDTGTLWLPEGTIEDWPDLQLRHIYWDDNHHLEKVDELKRYIRQAAFYKINGFVIKLNGHFQYKSAPALVDPYALSPAQLQELTNYGLRYHVQLIPYLDGPGHLAFILKHPEYAKLREYPESNFEICSTNPAVYKLLESMYQDLLDANKGVKYFYLSTDESYYVGLSHNAQCNEADFAKKLGSAGKVLAEFVDKAGGYLHDQGRTVMFWGEFPLKPDDIPSIPQFMVNGEVAGPALDKAFRRNGNRQMIYTSVEGQEMLFPDYSILSRSQRLHQEDSKDEFADNPSVPRLESITKKISFDSSRVNSDLIGEIDAGWGDAGLHPETFWLGYVASSAAGWHPGYNLSEFASSFYPLFYGPRAVDMDRIYRLMSEQAQSWTDSWDPTISTARKPLWGSYYAIFNPPHPAHDQTLPLPPPPNNDLDYTSTWSSENSRRIDLASHAKRANDNLLGLLHENITRSQYNRYNLEVYLSIANLYRQNSEMIRGISRMDQDLASAAQTKAQDPEKTIADVDHALDTATSIWQQRNEVFQNAVATWSKSWFPRVADANGRHFLHELDDVKDHLPDRTVDMSYLIYREKLLPFGTWVNSILTARNEFAAAHHLPARTYRLAWDDFQTISSVCFSTSDVLANPQMQPDTDQPVTCRSAK